MYITKCTYWGNHVIFFGKKLKKKPLAFPRFNSCLLSNDSFSFRIIFWHLVILRALKHFLLRTSEVIMFRRKYHDLDGPRAKY